MVPGQRTVHADRGSSMTSQSVALLRSDLGGVKTHSRPYVSADHPYAEAPFKTLKYRPGFPDRFSSLAAARGFCQEFFPWYNHEHHPAGLNWMTPATVHYGLAEKRISARQSVLDAAYQAHPERSSSNDHRRTPLGRRPSGLIRLRPNRTKLLKLLRRVSHYC
jgi:putative transposase